MTIESARLADRTTEAERLFDRRQRRGARALGPRLASDPVLFGARLRGTAAGCRRLPLADRAVERADWAA